MEVLLDTHALLRAKMSPKRLSRRSTAMVADERNVILVSAASAWEIATRVRLVKLPGAERFENEFLQVVEDSGYTMLPIDGAMALRAGRFTANHGDPFDRMIAAQALAIDVPVLSLDEKLDAFGVRRIW